MRRMTDEKPACGRRMDGSFNLNPTAIPGIADVDGNLQFQ